MNDGWRALAASTIAIATACATPALAAPGVGVDPYVTGLGGERCAAFTRHVARRDSGFREAAQWIIGYMSGRIEAPVTDDHAHLGSGFEVVSAVDRYCRTHPDQQIDDAVNAVFNRPAPTRGPH